MHGIHTIDYSEHMPDKHTNPCSSKKHIFERNIYADDLRLSNKK